jgi:MFS family permease
MSKHRRFQFPHLNFQIWILAVGRLLSQIGTGFTLFYAPIFFVNQVGLSATAVGMALGSGSVSGIVGRFFGGSFADSQWWGRRKTLLLSAAISAIADVFLALTDNFLTLVIGNLFMGLGVGLYWPATEAAVADLTTIEQRNEAFAITRLADSIGLSLGVVLGGALIAGSGNYRALFIIDGLSFLIFFVIVYLAISETYQFHEHQLNPRQGWGVALSDRRLIIYAIYLSINSQCWAIGYLIGPPIGGWVLDRSPSFAHSFWLASAVSIVIGISILQYLNRILEAN